MAVRRSRPERPAPDDGASEAALRPGLVVSHLGKGLAVETETGDLLICQTRRRLGEVTVGDRILWLPADDGSGRVERVLPRRSLLTRPGYAGKLRYVAANLDRLFVVIALQPTPDWLLVDQYLAVCTHRGIDAEIIVNKEDLLETDAADTFGTTLEDYRKLGYPVSRVSARKGSGMDLLRRAVTGRTVMLAGQSGVGKSSITNALLPERNLRVNELSEKSGLGRHTTTAATLYHLPTGGDLIDSPGVSVFGLAEMSWIDLAHAFIEFREHMANCRFNDCRHLADKGCAVRTAAESGAISMARYQRFIKLWEKWVADQDASKAP